MGDHTTGFGKYMYVEASSPNFPQKTCVLESRCVDISGMQRPYLEFWYSMFGTNIGVLKVELFFNYEWITIWELSGNKGMPWLLAEINLAKYKGSIKYRFHARTAWGFSGDIAIDDIKIYDKPQRFDVGVDAINEPAPYQCSGSTVSPIKTVVINHSTDSITQLYMDYKFNAISWTDTINKLMLSGDTSVITSSRTINLSASGMSSLSVKSRIQFDAYPWNDSIIYSIFTGNRPANPIIAPITVCLGDTGFLNYTGTADSVFWFSSNTNTTVRSKATNLVLVGLFKDTTVFISAGNNNSLFVPPYNKDFSDGDFTSAGVNGLRFTVSNPNGILIETVDVYSKGAGQVTINLKNGTTLVYSRVFNLVDGKNVLAINYWATRAALILDAQNITSQGLFRNDQGAFYPYVVPGVVSITNSTVDNQFYYYFYNWKISGITCASSRTAIPIYVKQKPTIAVTPNQTGITNGDTIHLRANAVGAIKWTPNTNLNTDTGSFVIASPIVNTNYVARVTDAFNCWNTGLARISVFPLGVVDSEKVKTIIYPNPTTERLILETLSGVNKDFSIKIITLEGKTAYSKIIKNNNSSKLEIDVSHLAAGSYMLQLKSNKSTETFKLIINK